MHKIEQWLLGILLGAIPPITGLLAGWWCTFSILSIDWVIVSAAAGTIAGLAVDAFFLKRWLVKTYQFDLKIWMAIYLFYSVCFFGFFMGVPVFNLALAVPAGLFIGRKLAISKAETEVQQKMVRQTRIFTTIVLAGICAASAWFALNSPSTAADLEGMLRLGFDVTLPMIWGLIAVGGIALLAANWWLVSKCARIARVR